MTPTAINNQILTIFRGQDWAQPFLPDPDATATSVSGAGLVVTIRDATAARAVLFTLTETLDGNGNGIVVTDAAAGKYTAKLGAAQTATLTGTSYRWDSWRTTPTGSKRRIAGGSLVVKTPEFAG